MFQLGKHFYRLWWSQIFSQTAVNMLHFTLMLELYQRTQSNFVVGILVFILSICPVLFSGFAGVVADKYNRRYVLMIVNMLRAVILAVMFFTIQFPALTLVFTFLFTAVAQFFPPAEGATIPELVPKDQLVSANSFFSFTFYGTFLVGFLVAGPLFELVGLHGVYAILIALYVIASYQNFRLPDITSHLHPERSLGSAFSFREAWRKLALGFKFILTDKLLCPLIILVSLLFGLERGAVSMIPELAKGILKYTNFEISLYLILPLGAGTVLGALMMNKFKQRVSRPTLIIAGSIVETIVFAAFFLVSAYPGSQSLFISIYALLIGLGDVFLIVGTQTLIQERMGTEIRGRAFGVVLTTVNVVGLPIILLLSFLSTKVDLIRLLSIAGGIGFAIVLVVGAYSLIRNKLISHNPFVGSVD